MKDYNLEMLKIYNENKDYSIQKLKLLQKEDTYLKGFDLKLYQNVLSKIIKYKEKQQQKIDKIRYVFI